MLILPAIDLKAGKCVRLTQGDFARESIYSQNPIAQAQQFESEGADWLHLVDLDGARTGAPSHLEVLEHICKATSLKVQFGGGLRTIEAARRALEAGAERVVLGSVLLRDPELGNEMLKELGERAVAMLDAKQGFVAANGWTETGLLPISKAQEQVVEMGAERIAVTDIGRDGTLEGPNFELLSSIVSKSSVPVIASGGVASLDDLRVLRTLGLEGVIVGKALYETVLTFQEALEAVSGQKS